jgi:hypothetical protein
MVPFFMGTGNHSGRETKGFHVDGFGRSLDRGYEANTKQRQFVRIAELEALWT